MNSQSLTLSHPGINGQVTYSILQSWTERGLPARRQQFTIDEETGQIYTNRMFDRESDGREAFMKVIATDSSEERLEGVGFKEGLEAATDIIVTR